jgi:hypothetical protein
VEAVAGDGRGWPAAVHAISSPERVRGGEGRVRKRESDVGGRFDRACLA